MNIAEYFSLLGLKPGASVSDIKKAYRIKALQYHPDRNHAPGAAEMFVRISEAYQYLLNVSPQSGVTDAEREKAYAAWVEYRREKAKREAESFARSSYAEFRKSELYKSSQSIDGRMVVFGFALSVFILVYTVYGYTYRIAQATCEKEMPSFPLMLLSLSVGIVFFIVTLLYFLAWKADKKREKDGKTNNVVGR